MNQVLFLGVIYHLSSTFNTSEKINDHKIKLALVFDKLWWIIKSCWTSVRVDKQFGRYILIQRYEVVLNQNCHYMLPLLTANERLCFTKIANRNLMDGKQLAERINYGMVRSCCMERPVGTMTLII